MFPDTVPRAGRKRVKRKFCRILERYKDLSMTSKISLAFISMLLPFVILMGFWFTNMLKSNEFYRKASQNTSVISEFSLDFKKNYDYKIYLIIVGNKSYESQKPVLDINNARAILDSVKALTLSRNSPDIIHNMENTWHHLERYTKAIQANIEYGGRYDENEELWETGVQSITSNIQQNMLELLYYENKESTQIYQDVNKRTVQMIAGSVFIIVILVIVAIVMITYIPRTISRPVRELCKVTEQAAEGDLTVRSHIAHGAELKVLSDSFNVMIEKTSNLIDRVKEEQTKLREAELEILQVQINPHFLYNTLDTIVWLAEAGDNEQVVNMVEVLSDFFRASLNGGKDIVTLEEEYRHVSSYLQIQQVRYKDILEYEIKLPEELGQVQIPKITLQPLVENALYHGIKNKRGKGLIRVYAYKKNDLCVIAVEDNGRGMTPEKLAEIKAGLLRQREEEKESYGLYNVNERIRLRFGNQYGLSFYSEDHAGTKVEIYLPVRYES